MVDPGRIRPAISPRAYGKLRAIKGLPGSDPGAVRKAIKTGRLVQSVDSHGWITDPDLADLEWAQNTNSALCRQMPTPSPGDPNGLESDGAKLASARARRELALAELAELELEEKKGTLLLAADVEREMIALVSASRARLLGIPARYRQQVPETTMEQYRILEELIREALTDLADNPP